MVDPPEVAELREDQREEQDPVASFVRECVAEKEGARVDLMPMREAYATYCKRMNISALGERALGNVLAKKLERGKSHGTMYWKDVTLTTSAYGRDAF